MAVLNADEAGSLRGGASFSLRHRLVRVVWSLAWTLLASWTPPPLRRWRCLLLRAFGARLAPTANVYASCRIWYPANLEMGDYACLGPRSIVYSMAPVTLGAYALVSQGAQLCAGTHDVEDAHFQLQTRPIRIGARAWIAADAFVGPGVSVGDGAVLGARGCAMRDLNAWTIYTGNPAAPLRPRRIRFSDAE